jgi:hypothetical protein
LKKFCWYLIYAVAFIIILLWLTNHAEELRIVVSRTYKPTSLIIYTAIYPVIIGMLLSLPTLYSKMKKEGRITLEWIRLVAVGVPALILTLSQILYWFTPFGRIIYPMLPEWGLAKETVMVGGIFLGYTLLSSIRKVDRTQ